MTDLPPLIKERTITFEEAIEVHKLISKGHQQSQIAAFFGTNQGRISEIKNEKRHAGSKALAFG